MHAVEIVIDVFVIRVSTVCVPGSFVLVESLVNQLTCTSPIG